MEEKASMAYPVFSRNIQVDYFEKSENLWRVTSHLKDHEHDILVTIEISVPDMVIRDAGVTFIRYPLETCLKFVGKMQKIVGTCLYTDFRESLARFFYGPEGCPNAGNLVAFAAPALIFFYFPNLLCRGKMKHEEWLEMMHTKLAGNCIAH